MPEPAITLCSSAALASLGPGEGVLAVCDSPITVTEITASPAFQAWPASSPIACFSLGEETSPLPQTIRWLVESPFRCHVVLTRRSAEALARPCSPDALWKRLAETQNVWTGSIAGSSPAIRMESPALTPQPPAKSWLKSAIQSFVGSTPRQTTLLKAGLYLIHDDLDESHTESQSLEGDRDADLWHAIMHRREPDYGNAKYWCRRVGSHPVHDQLAPVAAPILARAGVSGFSSTRWDAFQFVDLCERVAHEHSSANLAAREVQWLEMTLHLAHCARGRQPVDADLEAIAVHEQLLATPAIWEDLAGGKTGPATQTALRKKYPAEVVRAALTLTDLRKHARLRFTRADQMWFDRTRLEQATQEIVAHHKASRFKTCAGEKVLDLCCGIGADAIAIAHHAPVVAVDLSPLATWFTRQNAAVYGVAENIETVNSDVESVDVAGRFVHLDPDRRTQGQRQVRLEFGSPALPYLQSLTQTARGGAIKVSPASNFGGKFTNCEVELISLNGECKEATIWFGDLRKPTPFQATILPQGVSISGDPWEYRPRIEPLKRYLFDPDPAVVRAGLVDCVAEQLDLRRLDDAEEYLTGDTLVDSPFVRGFEVLADLNNNTREIRDYFRTSPFGQVEIKCRHMSIDADAIRRKLPLPGHEPGVLLFVRVAGKARAVVARRCS